VLEFARELPIADRDSEGLDCLQSRRELNGPEIIEKLAQVAGRPIAPARSDAAFGTFRYTKLATGDAAVFVQEWFNRAVVFPGGRVPHRRVGGSADDKSGQRITQVFLVRLEEHASAER